MVFDINPTPFLLLGTKMDLAANLQLQRKISFNRLGDHLKGLCFVDLDKTLISQTLAPLFGKWLWKRGEIDLKSLIRSLIVLWLYRLKAISFKSLIESITLKGLKGRSIQQLQQLANLFAISLRRSVFHQKTVSFLKEIAPTHLCILTSRSPDFLVSAIANSLSFDGWQASVWIRDLQVCETINGFEKRQLFQKLLKDLSLQQKDCIALSDSFDDFPLLKVAGRSIAVGPDKKLRAAARSNQWEIWN